MQSYRPVHRGDQRHFDVEEVHQDLFALAPDFVVALGREEIEAVEGDLLHERIAGAGQDHDAVVRSEPIARKRSTNCSWVCPLNTSVPPSVCSATSSTPVDERLRRALGKLLRYVLKRLMGSISVTLAGLFSCRR